jgi:hypothetical protein
MRNHLTVRLTLQFPVGLTLHISTCEMLIPEAFNLHFT